MPLEQLTSRAHVQLLSSYWMPFSLLGLHCFVQHPRWRYLVLFAGTWYLQAGAFPGSTVATSRSPSLS